jgi:hypothetical protein
VHRHTVGGPAVRGTHEMQSTFGTGSGMPTAGQVHNTCTQVQYAVHTHTNTQVNSCTASGTTPGCSAVSAPGCDSVVPSAWHVDCNADVLVPVQICLFHCRHTHCNVDTRNSFPMAADESRGTLQRAFPRLHARRCPQHTAGRALHAMQWRSPHPLQPAPPHPPT